MALETKWSYEYLSSKDLTLVFHQGMGLFSSSLLPFSLCVVSENVKYIFSISIYPLPEKIILGK